jgi:hypothetical protein
VKEIEMMEKTLAALQEQRRFLIRQAVEHPNDIGIARIDQAIIDITARLDAARAALQKETSK